MDTREIKRILLGFLIIYIGNMVYIFSAAGELAAGCFIGLGLTLCGIIVSLRHIFSKNHTDNE